jgi:hypothetical protein
MQTRTIMKGIVSRDSVSTNTTGIDILSLNNLPRISFAPGESCVKNILRIKHKACRCKMAGILKCVLRTMAYRGV